MRPLCGRCGHLDAMVRPTWRQPGATLVGRRAASCHAWHHGPVAACRRHGPTQPRRSTMPGTWRCAVRPGPARLVPLCMRGRAGPGGTASTWAGYTMPLRCGGFPLTGAGREFPRSRIGRRAWTGPWVTLRILFVELIGAVLSHQRHAHLAPRTLQREREREPSAPPRRRQKPALRAMDLDHGQHGDRARRRNRSATNIHHLSLAPLTAKLPLDDADGGHLDAALRGHGTSYRAGKSAPTTLRLLSRCATPSHSRSHQRVPSAPGAPMVKSVSSTHVAAAAARRRASGTATRRRPGVPGRRQRQRLAAAHGRPHEPRGARVQGPDLARG